MLLLKELLKQRQKRKSLLGKYIHNYSNVVFTFDPFISESYRVWKSFFFFLSFSTCIEPELIGRCIPVLFPSNHDQNARILIQVMVFKNGPSKICGRRYGLPGRPYHLKFFNGCFPQIVFGPFLNTLTHLQLHFKSVTYQPNSDCLSNDNIVLLFSNCAFVISTYKSTYNKSKT